MYRSRLKKTRDRFLNLKFLFDTTAIETPRKVLEHNSWLQNNLRNNGWFEAEIMSFGKNTTP